MASSVKFRSAVNPAKGFQYSLAATRQEDSIPTSSDPASRECVTIVQFKCSQSPPLYGIEMSCFVVEPKGILWIRATARRHAVAMALLALLAPSAVGQGQSSPATFTIRYLCLPHPFAPVAISPSAADIRQFTARPSPSLNASDNDKRFGDVLENRADDFSANLEFGRWVFGQRQLLKQARLFASNPPQEILHLLHGRKLAVRVRFLEPWEWRQQIDSEVDVAGHPERYSTRAAPDPDTVIVAQIGDTWENYYLNRGDVTADQLYRFYYDIRFLWYWRSEVSEDALRSRAAFTNLLKGLKKTHDENESKASDTPNPVPLEVQRSPDLDELWSLFVFVQAFGGELVTNNGPGGWTESKLAGPAGKEAVATLGNWLEKGWLVVPNESNIALTEGFLAHECSMCVMEPWVAWRAKKMYDDRAEKDYKTRHARDYTAFQLSLKQHPEKTKKPPWDTGNTWYGDIGIALMPDLRDTLGDKPNRRTFIGGSLLAVMNPVGSTNPELLEVARRWAKALGAAPIVGSPGNSSDATAPVSYSVTSDDSATESLQFIPPAGAAWEQVPRQFRQAFFDAMHTADPATAGKFLSEYKNADQLPELLEELRKTWSPPVLPNTPDAVESDDVQAHLNDLWKDLALAHQVDPSLPHDLTADKQIALAKQELGQIGKSMDAKLSPGALKFWILTCLAILLAPFAAYGIFALLVARARRKMRRTVHNARINLAELERQRQIDLLLEESGRPSASSTRETE